MGIHRELAELVGRAGDDVLRDAADFRAAVDDFVSEGSASEGELNLLTDAVRLGALERVVAQVGHGAEAGRAIELQSARLAEQRGTEEVRGPRWALTVLCFALGLVGEDAVAAAGRGEPAPPSPTIETLPPPPPVPPPPPRPRVPPPTELPVTLRRDRATVATGPAPRRARHGRRWLGAGVALAVAGGVVVAVLLRDGDAGRQGDPTRDPTVATQTVPSGTVLSSSVRPPAVAKAVVMAGRTGGVRVTALGEVDAVGTGPERQVAAEGERLFAFTLADGPCQASTCRDWASLGLDVVVDGDELPLPDGGPTFVVPVPTADEAELRFDADGYDQRVSLLDGSPTGRNIEVLSRAVRTFDVDGSATVKPVGVPPIEPHVRTIHLGAARLFFFRGSKGLVDPGEAYLALDVSYSRSDVSGRFAFYFSEVHLEGAGGKRYPKLDLDRSTEVPELAFTVPADFTHGTLVVSGTRQASGTRNDGSTATFRLTLPRTPVPFTLADQ